MGTSEGGHVRRTIALLLIGLLLALGHAAPASGASLPEPRPRFGVESATLNEISGMAVDSTDRLVFVHEDARKPALVYALDRTGQIRATIEIPFDNEDWEDMAVGVAADGSRLLYIADTGDAFFVREEAGLPSRTEFAVIRLQEPDVDVTRAPATVAATEAVRFPLVYDDEANHNSETLLVRPTDNRVFVVDKTEQPQTRAYLWAAPAELVPNEVNRLERIAQVPVTGASSGDFSPSGDRFVIRNAESAFLWRTAGEDLARALLEPPVVVPLPPSQQGEGIAFTPDGNALLTSSEGGSSVVWEVPLPPEARSEEEPEADEDGAAATAPTPRSPLPLYITAGASAGLVLLATTHGIRSWRRRR